MQAAYISEEEKLEFKKKVSTPLLWIGIMGIIMFFGGLTSAYVVRQAQGNWLFFDIPVVFYKSTVVIIISSITMIAAQIFAKRGNAMFTSISLIATVGLGFIFTYLQYSGFLELEQRGIHFTGPDSNVSGSFFIVFIFAHVAHLFGGLFALIFTSIKSLLNRYTSENHIGIKTLAVYWHFLDILWIYLILFLAYIR